MRVALAIVLLLLFLCSSLAQTADAASTPVTFSSAEYSIRVAYFLINANFEDQVVSFTVPIPPNTTWQTSYFRGRTSFPSLTPLPYHDLIGNALMDFSIPVPALNVTTFTYDVSVRVNATPGYPTRPAQVGTRSQIPATLANLTSPTHWWNYTDPEFASPILNLLFYRTDDNLTRVAKAVRDTVVGSGQRSALIDSIRASRVRLGATQAVQLSIGDASEYSDVFVALMRSMNVPATRLWSWLVSDVRGGVVSFRGFVQSAFWSPTANGWLPYDVTTSRYVDRPAIGEVSDRIITFYIEHNLPGPGRQIPLLLNQDESFFPGGGVAVKSGIVTTTRVIINYVPEMVSMPIQLFTLTTTVGIAGVALILIVIISAIGYQRARSRRRRYQERLDEFEKRLRGVTRG